MSEKNPELEKAIEALDGTWEAGVEMVNVYDKWAKDYDKDAKLLGYSGYEIGARKLVQFLEQYKFGTDCKILDVGSGTGLVGGALRELNYTNVDGIEPSEGSNEIARSKGIYKRIFVEALAPGKQTSISSDTYDASLCIGVMTVGHMKAEGALDEMARVVKPGGLVCFTIREDVLFDKDYGHEEMMAKLCDNGAWKLLSDTRVQHIQKIAVKHSHLFVYQAL